MSSTDALFERYYYNKPGFQNGRERFFEMVRQAAPQNASLLEIGAGPKNARTEFFATLGDVTGIDISDEVFDNPDLVAAHQFEGREMPFPDNSFDACVSVYVLEHVEDAEAHFREVSRVLKPGGTYCFWTPNLWHYVSAGSNILPHSAHLALANKLRGRGEEAHDPYPTFYHANTESRLRRLAKASGLRPERLELVETEPSYGRAHPALFYPMMAYERLVNRVDALRGLRANFQGVFRG